MGDGDKAPSTVAGALANSWAGLRWALVEDGSFRRQAMGSLALMGVMGLVRPELTWWILAALASLLVMSMELINSAIEIMIDHLHPDRHEQVRIVKDLSSAAVVLANVGQAAVGISVLVMGWRSLS